MKTRSLVTLLGTALGFIFTFAIFGAVSAQTGAGDRRSFDSLTTDQMVSIPDWLSQALRQDDRAGESYFRSLDLLNFPPSATTAVVRYVAPGGSDEGNNCLDSSQPCQTLPWAVRQAQPDEVLKLAAGTYTNPDIAVEGRLL